MSSYLLCFKSVSDLKELCVVVACVVTLSFENDVQSARQTTENCAPVFVKLESSWFGVVSGGNGT